MPPASIATFWYAVIGSPFGEWGQPPEDRDTSELALRYQRARDYFEQLTGVQETPSVRRQVPDCGPTVVRSILNLQSATCDLKSEMVLLNLTGRQVMDLKPGPKRCFGPQPRRLLCPERSTHDQGAAHG
jgi:hypothetical protein